MTKRLLTKNQYSRSGRRLSGVKAIVIHWFAAPGQTANDVWHYWESRKDGTNSYGAAHIIIDDRSTVVAVPLDEIAYHVGSDEYTQFASDHIGSYPNGHTIGVELAHDDWTGKPTFDVWGRAVGVCRELCARFTLPPDKVVTHWDVTGMRPHWNGRPCHRWFVEQPGELARLRAEIEN